MAHPFPGTDEELFRLAEAAAHNCTCAEEQPTCPAHCLLIDEEMAKHLVFYARRAWKLIQEEFKP